MTRLELSTVPLPIETRTYKPVPHMQLVNTTLEACDKLGLKIKSESYIGSGDGGIVTGYYDLLWEEDKDMGVRIAFQNSYNKKVTLKYAVGGDVFVCSNGMIRGDVGAYKKKHVGDVQIIAPTKIEEYLKTVGDNFSQLVKDKEEMKKIDIGKKALAELIGDMYLNENLIKETQISIIKKQIENPSFDYAAPGTLWEAYNHVTHSLKTSHASNYIDTHSAVHNYILGEFSIL